MTIVTSPIEMQRISLELKTQSSIGFVPTMGALHKGHQSLVERVKKECDHCIVSLFVNPTQFNDSNDFLKYPKTLDEDHRALSDLKVDILFQPRFEDIYPDDYNFSVVEKNWSSKLCGKSRPGHFTGVLTVVLKLLNIVQPTKAFFGEKDFQQLQLIKEMAKAFFIPTEVIPCPTVRDEHGLALSSRNKRLSIEGINKARVFAEKLKNANDPSDFYASMKQLGIQVDYLEEIADRRFAAVEIENVRLIDNVPL